jgi:hypothetical protein
MNAPLTPWEVGLWSGYETMKFALTYDGELRSNRGPADKWDIRKQLDPQLRELWGIDPSLQRALRLRHLVQDGTDPIMRAPLIAPTNGSIDLLAPIERSGRQFFPLVRNSLLLKCRLKILFLRKEDAGRIYQGGDLDNRLKTLFDALAVPNNDQIVSDDTISDPIYALLEDDALITGFDVESGRLLSRPGASVHEARLVIEVDVRVTQPRLYNQPFLGD